MIKGKTEKKPQEIETETETVAMQIQRYVDSTSGLSVEFKQGTGITVQQKIDGKAILFRESDIDLIMSRTDDRERTFIQVNFHSGRKVLLTDQLIGFKPSPIEGIKMESLPTVVATPDLVSLFEAMEECLEAAPDNVPTFIELRHAFMSIVEGGEAVGIDFSKEKLWIKQMVLNKKTAANC